MNDPAIAELTRQLVGLSNALARSEERAKKSAEASKANSEAKKAEAAQAAKLSSILTKLAEDVTGVSAKTEHHGRVFNTATAVLRTYATEGVGAATQALQAWIAQIPEGASRAEAHQRALAQLGGAYDAVRSATNGAVSAEQAALVQQKAAQAGLRLTSAELAAVTQRARDYARATGTDLGQALDQLSDQLVDPGEELRRFGIFLQTGASAGDMMRETLRQITAQAGTTAPAVQSLAEAQEDFHRATQEASDALSATVAQELGLRDFYTSLASWIRDATTAASTFDHVVDGVVGTLREMVGLQSSVAQQQNQSRSGAFMERAGGLAAAARARGVNLGGLQLGAIAQTTNAEEQGRIESLLRTLGERGPQRAADPLFAGGGAFQGAGGFELAEIERIAAGARARQAQETARAAAERARLERERQREINRRNAASASAGGRAGSSGPPQLPHERHGDAAGLALLFSPATRIREEREEMFSATEDKRMSSAEAANDNGSAYDQYASDRNADTIEARERRQYEQRYEALRGFSDLWEQEHSRQLTAVQGLVQGADAAFQSFGQAYSKHLGLLVSGQESAGQALQGFLADTLEGVSARTGARAGEEFAEGLASLASPITAPLAPAHFAAAAAFTGVSVATGVAGAAMRPSTPAAGAGGAARGAGDLPPGVGTGRAPERREGVTVNISLGGGVVLGTPRELAEQLGRVLNDPSADFLLNPDRVRPAA